MKPNKVSRIIEATRNGSFSAWLELQRYKMYHPLGVWVAIWWLKVRYGWDDTKEKEA